MQLEFLVTVSIVGFFASYLLIIFALWAHRLGMPRLDFSKAMTNFTFDESYQGKPPYGLGLAQIFINGMPMKHNLPPDHLSDAAKQFFSEVVRDFTLEPTHIRLLTLACQAWDRAEDARVNLIIHGTVFTDRFDQPRARPEVKIEHDARISFARMMRELGLESNGPGLPRPPAI